MSFPDLASLGTYASTIPGKYEVITQSLYDMQSYAAAGATSYSFFQLPIGQSSKTLADTNMVLAGQIPAQQIFYCQSVEVEFFPTTPTVAAAMPAAFGAQAIAVQVNDVYLVRRYGGSLTLTIGSKPYLQEAPLMKFPAKANFVLHAALSDATTASANYQSRIAFANAMGRPYSLANAPIVIAPNMNFNVTIAFPTAVAISNPAVIGVVLDGGLYRQAQ